MIETDRLISTAPASPQEEAFERTLRPKLLDEYGWHGGNSSSKYREVGKRDMKRLEKFLLATGPAIPRTTLRYAIERFPEKKRRDLLLQTKVEK